MTDSLYVAPGLYAAQVGIRLRPLTRYRLPSLKEAARLIMMTEDRPLRGLKGATSGIIKILPQIGLWKVCWCVCVWLKQNGRKRFSFSGSVLGLSKCVSPSEGLVQGQAAGPRTHSIGFKQLPPAPILNCLVSGFKPKIVYNSIIFSFLLLH